MLRLAGLLVLPLATAAAQAPQLANLREVPFPQVKVADRFFAPRRAVNRRVTLEHSLKQLEETGTLGNFDLAAQGKREGFKGYVFQDSDAYKAIEAIAFALADAPDPELEARLDAIIARIAKSQQPDGYLNSWYTVNAPEKRFSNLRDNHEIYCAGHLFEAAAAHFRATKKRTLLDVACKYADLLVQTFGDGPGQRTGYCGHPEAELALVELADVSGKESYFELARHMVTKRGSKIFAAEHGTDPARYDGTYWLDHLPISDLTAIAGHAVRATYLMSGAVDVAARTGDQALLAMARRVWRNTMERNVFVTGGIGPSASNEGFTVDWDLPTHTAYQESCASIAVAMWAHRMALLYGDGRYADAMETALYNAIPAGVQLDGTRFFYVNPLASRGNHHRREWYGCACCPPNLARTLAAVGGYAFATGSDSLWVNLYVQGSVRARVGDADLELTVTTEYPWAPKVVLTVTSQAPVRARLCLRVPAWCDGASVEVNDAKLDDAALARGYRAIERTWQPGDKVALFLPMPVRRLEADPRAEALRGRVAFARGPIVFCAEQCDQGVALDRLVVPPGAAARESVDKDALGGIVRLAVDALDCGTTPFPPRTLYRPQAQPQRATLTLVPYAVWDNRAAGAMDVWFPQAVQPLPAKGPEASAKLSMSFVSRNCDPEGARDGEEPKKSGDTPARNCHWWPHKGTTEWIEYAWETPQRLDGCRIYWFDDTGHGECRLAKAARLLYHDGTGWQPVALGKAGLPIAVDRWCEVQFAPVATTALRLEVEMQPRFAAGVLEWRVNEAADDR